MPSEPRSETGRVRVHFQWQIQYACNYRCPYCVFETQWESVLKLDRRDIPPERWLAAWERLYARYGSMDIFITGGEPSYHPRFVDILEALTRAHYVSFDTNLSWRWEDLERFVRVVGKRRIRLDTSFHSHSVPIEEFIGKASFLRDHGINYVCRLVGWPPLLAKVAGFREAFSKAGLVFVVYPFQGVYEGRRYPDSYTEEERTIVRGPSQKEGLERNNAEQPDLVGHILDMHREAPAGRLCRSGYVYARALPDGTVFRCQPYESRRWEPLGNIFDESFELRPGPSLCRSPACEFEYRYLVRDGEPAGAS